MGWFQAVARDSITRSYLQCVSIKRDGPECLRTESFILSVVPASWKSDSRAGKLPVSCRGGTCLVSVCVWAGAQHMFLFTQGFCIPKSKAKGPQRFMTLYLVGNCQVGCSSYWVYVPPISEARSAWSEQNWLTNKNSVKLLRLLFPAFGQGTNLTKFLTSWIVCFTKETELVAGKLSIIEAKFTFSPYLLYHEKSPEVGNPFCSGI